MVEHGSYDFSDSHVWMWELDHKEGQASENWCFWIVVMEKIRESLGQQGDETSQSYRKSTLNIHYRDWCWSWSTNTLTTWCKETTHWKRTWCRKRLKAGEEGSDRGWDGWMASPTQWTWVWANSRRQWKTGKPGMLQSRGLQTDKLSNWTTAWKFQKKTDKNPEGKYKRSKNHSLAMLIHYS